MVMEKYWERAKNQGSFSISFKYTTKAIKMKSSNGWAKTVRCTLSNEASST